MKQWTIEKSQLSGSITIPSSKSHTHRAILFGLMGKGTTTIRRPLNSPDTSCLIEACRLLGSKIEVNEKQIKIQGIASNLNGADDVLNVGNSGIALRFLSALAALSSKPIVITGDHSIRHLRPMNTLLEALQQLGVQAISTKNDGFAPLIIQGPMQGNSTTVNGKDSQPVSSLLIASAFAKHPIEIHVENPGEIPWIDLTLSWLDRMHIPYKRDGYRWYRLEGNTHYSGFDYEVPGDFSSAAFPMAAALITRSEITLQNLDQKDVQGDQEIINIVQKMGASIQIDPISKTLHLKGNQSLHGITIDLNHCIDAITTVAAIACFAKGETRIINASVAREKECDRIDCIAKELNKMGGCVTPTEDGLLIQGTPLQGTTVDSYHDHRMAMSLAVAALGAKGKTTVNNVNCVEKTYSTFAKDFQSLGANIHE